MLEIGVVELGLSPDEFWDLSWYEWGLYVLRQKKQAEKEKYHIENGWEQTRTIWATLVNIHSSKKVKPSDLIELSFDKKVIAESKRKTPEEVEAKFNKKKHGSNAKGIS